MPTEHTCESGIRGRGRSLPEPLGDTGSGRPARRANKGESDVAMALKLQMIRVIRVEFPMAYAVCLVGAFNNWSTVDTPMVPVGSGMWEARLEASIPPQSVWFFVYDAGRRFGHLVRGSPADYTPQTAGSLPAATPDWGIASCAALSSGPR